MFSEWNSFGTLDDCSSLSAQITATAQQYGLDPTISYNQLTQESGCDPFATSPKGAQGIAQFMPGTWLQWGTEDTGDRTDITASLDAFGAYMRDLLNTFGGDYPSALAAYNAGPSAVNRYGGVPPASFSKGQAYNYVQSILSGSGKGMLPAGSLGTTASSGSVDSGSGGGSIFDTSGFNVAAGIAGASPLAILALAVVALVVFRR